jgi:L-alanine-DL-glutamate epimerase-like enolase superfamily enzyme
MGTGERIDAARVSLVSRRLDAPFRTRIHQISHMRNVVVELRSESNVGSGYTFCFNGSHAAAMKAIAVELAGAVVGRRPSDVRAVWDELFAGLNFVGVQGPPGMALAAVDMAMWDLHAQNLGVPVHAVLGLDAVASPVYRSGGSLDLDGDRLVVEAKAAQAEGFAGYKLRVGSADLADDVARVGMVRDAVGKSYTLMVDANQAWTRAQAVRASAALAEFDLLWLEEPIVAGDTEGLARLRRLGHVAIAAGETEYGVSGALELIKGDAVDVLQPDLMRSGGVTPMLDVAAVAKAYNTAVMPHLYAEQNAHLIGLCGRGAMIEHLGGWFEHLYGALPFASGTLAPPESPGWGRGLLVSPSELTEPVEIGA